MVSSAALRSRRIERNADSAAIIRSDGVFLWTETEGTVFIQTSEEMPN